MLNFYCRLYSKKNKIKMLGGPGGDDPDAGKQMANAQVTSSFIQFLVAVGIINLGRKD